MQCGAASCGPAKPDRSTELGQKQGQNTRLTSIFMYFQRSMLMPTDLQIRVPQFNSGRGLQTSKLDHDKDCARREAASVTNHRLRYADSLPACAGWKP